MAAVRTGRDEAGRADAIDGHRVSTTVVMSLAAVAAALIAIFGEKGSFTAVVVAGALAGLLPWALVAGGVRVPPTLFAAMSLVAVWVVVVVGDNPGGMFPAMLLVVWITRVSADVRVVAATVVLAFAAIAWHAAETGSAHETGLVYFTGGLGISALAGLMVRRQEALNDELQAMHGLRLEHAAAGERARIAREVHDVVAHSMTVMMLHLTGARRALATEPARAADALERAETVGRESLDQIRGVVGLLRDGDGADAPATVPLPGLADIAPLVDGYRSGGLAVDAELDALDPARLDPTAFDPTVGLVAYRIVQEALSNVVQHAGGAATSVVVSVRAHDDADELVVEVVNAAGATRPARPDRVGLGVRGMHERVRAMGGTIDAGPVAGGGWRVAARLPMRTVAVRDVATR